ncbi:MAG: TetR/AcrR family transcriptional regulator [Pseudobacter sp.]|uniref:TetR/AcrR family transcriptional regulator n=1 Tax=Pseudobacter sp. TaxID=2045420 RepID=UPI003F814AEC
MKKAEATRLTILQKAFELIYGKGYQVTSVDEIIATTKVTKGAFYYHFKSKDEMGLAIINEILKPSLTRSFIEPLEKEADPLHAIYNLLYHLLMKDKFLKVEYGCPASNFTQEMAPWNKLFSEALEDLTSRWEKLMITTLENGKKRGEVRQDVNSKQVIRFIMSGYWGIRNFGKLSNSKEAYKPWLKELKSYLEGLR